MLMLVCWMCCKENQKQHSGMCVVLIKKVIRFFWNNCQRGIQLSTYLNCKTKAEKVGLRTNVKFFWSFYFFIYNEKRVSKKQMFIFVQQKHLEVWIIQKTWSPFKKQNCFFGLSFLPKTTISTFPFFASSWGKKKEQALQFCSYKKHANVVLQEIFCNIVE